MHFGGVNNAFYAWLNGRLLGYSQDSCCPAEFEVTTALQPGDNVLAVQVRCQGSEVSRFKALQLQICAHEA